MNEIILLDGKRPRRILETFVDEGIPAAMSYLCEGRWRVVRVLLTEIGEDSFTVRISPIKKSYRLDLQAGQSVGISLKQGYGSGNDKFVFDTTILVVNFAGGAELSLKVPEQMEMVSRRSYSRVNVPEGMEVTVSFWQRYCTSEDGQVTVAAGPDWEGKLIDISAGGMQIAIDGAARIDFKKGDSVGLRFEPMPFESPVMCNGQIENILPTADGKNICIGLKIIGLEASPEGRLVLSRLVGIVDQYQQMNESVDKPEEK